MIAAGLPLAHAGHWINGALYLLPVLIVALLPVVAKLRGSDGACEADDLHDPDGLDGLDDLDKTLPSERQRRHNRSVQRD